MSFNFGQRVRLNRDLQMCGFAIRKGTSGTVANVHLQTSVLFDGLDQELAVANNDLEELSGSNKKGAVSTVTTSAVAATGAFQIGRHVRLLVTKHLGGQTIPAGSLGTVTQDAPSMNASWVLFDGFSGDKLIPNDDLEAA